jgi:hypothetical protein
MSRAIPARRRCAAPFSNRIELQPSVRAAVLAAAWLCAIGGVIFAAPDLPLLARIAICTCVATMSVATIQSVFLLGGPNAIRAMHWSESDQLYASLGRDQRKVAVVLAPGSFRLGRKWLLLWLKSCDGVHGVLIDEGMQDPQAFRRLCRRLESLRNAIPGEPPNDQKPPS